MFVLLILEHKIACSYSDGTDAPNVQSQRRFLPTQRGWRGVATVLQAMRLLLAQKSWALPFLRGYLFGVVDPHGLPLYANEPCPAGAVRSWFRSYQ